MDHQDWKPVIFSQKKTAATRTQHNKAVSHLPSKMTRALTSDDPESLVNKKFERSFINEVVTKRVSQGLDQKAFAARMGMRHNDIQLFEQGKMVYSPQLKSRFMKYLQTTP
jgi:ribosome-binding protein aMBF1 (putative translation factor)